MSWAEPKPLNWFQKFCIKILKCGKIPQHVGIIMDGNRRYGRVNNVHKFEAHLIGYEKLVEVLPWVLELGIPEVTLYTFSMDNFKRSPAEVNMLMKLLKNMFDDTDYYMKKDIEIRVLGDISSLPLVVQKSVAKGTLLCKKKKKNSKLVMNMAIAYSAREEMTNAIKTIASGVKEGSIELSDINEHLISKCLYTNNSPNLDLVIRTGEKRLSDFLLWQVSSSCLYFENIYWPQFSFWDVFRSLIYYQCHSLKLKLVRDMEASLMSQPSSGKVGSFLTSVDTQRYDHLQHILELKD